MGFYCFEFIYFCEEILDQVPPFVGVLVVVALELAVRFRWDDRARTAHVEFREKPIGVEWLCRQENIESHAIDQRFDALHVVGLTWQENEI